MEEMTGLLQTLLKRLASCPLSSKPKLDISGDQCFAWTAPTVPESCSMQ